MDSEEFELVEMVEPNDLAKERMAKGEALSCEMFPVLSAWVQANSENGDGNVDPIIPLHALALIASYIIGSLPEGQQQQIMASFFTVIAHKTAEDNAARAEDAQATRH